VDLAGTTIPEAIATQSDRISISGVQSKLIVDLADDGGRLFPSDGGRYILKVPSPSFANLSENEHLTMSIAKLVGVAVPRFGLIELSGGGIGYIVKRFDRTDENPPSKRLQEDFCSLLELDPNDKYLSTTEQCIEVVRKLTDDPETSARRLFLQFALAFWIGNDDLHLKNLSLSGSDSGGYTLSLAYDLVCTRLYPQLTGKRMALKINDRDLHLQHADFIALAAHARIPADEAEATIEDMRAKHVAAEQLIERSVLPGPLQVPYRQELRRKNRALAKPSRRKS